MEWGLFISWRSWTGTAARFWRGGFPTVCMRDPELKALEEIMARCGNPEIFNTDQGSQFPGHDGITYQKTAKVRVSMVGKGR